MSTSPSTSISPAPERHHDEELQELVKYGKELGKKYGAPYIRTEKAFTDEFYINADKLIRLRAKFGDQGSHRKLVIDGSEYTWQTFCEPYLGITPQHFNRQVKAVAERRRKAELDAAERTELAGPLTAGQLQESNSAESISKPEAVMSKRERQAWQNGFEEGKKRTEASPTKQAAHNHFVTYQDDLSAYMNELQDMFADHGFGPQVSRDEAG